MADPLNDARLYAPAAARNRDFICDVLRDHLPPEGTVLELGSGSGEHIVHFANAFPDLTFQPSDRKEEAAESTKAWVRESVVQNVKPFMFIDLYDAIWPIETADVIISINVVHIAPWSATPALVDQASKILSPGGLLFFYGPFFRNGVETAQGNIDFDLKLRSEDPSMGIRNLDEIGRLAGDAGFHAPQIIDMPANNISVIFIKK